MATAATFATALQPAPVTARGYDLPDLSPAEWGALRVGLKDAANGTCAASAPRREPGRLGRIGRAVFGGHPVPALANPRLDSLRRFVCATRSGRGAGPALMTELTNFGFEPRHIATFLGLMA